MTKTLKAYLFVFAFYIVLYINYFVENDNIHNVTITLLWINTILYLFGAIVSLNSKYDYKPKNNTISKVIIIILLFFASVVMVYFGDFFMGIIYGISLLTIITKNNDI